MEEERIAIIGAGELGCQIAHLAHHNNHNIVGFFDDYNIETCLDLPILGTFADVESVFQNHMFNRLVIGIGYKHFDVRSTLFHKFSALGIKFATIIDKTCIIDETATIGEGCVVYPSCVIDKDVVINNNVLLNLSVVIAHNSTIGSHSFLAPRCTISGFSSIGERNFCGVNTTIIDNIQICNDVYMGASACVVKNITQPGRYVGVPAKII